MGNGMRGMTGMRVIRVELMEMRGMNEGIQRIWGGNEGNQGENLRIGVEVMYKKCREE